MTSNGITPIVSFGRTLQGPDYEPLRVKLSSLARERVLVPLHVDTVLGFDPPGTLKDQTVRKFVLLDIHRVFVFDEFPNEPGVDSLLNFILDDYPTPVTGIKSHFETHPFQFFYPLEALEILGRIWTALPYGHAATLELSTGVIRMALVHRHPRGSSDGEPPCEQLRFQPTIAGPSFRTGIVCRAEGLVSPDAGILRDERLTSTYVSLPNAVARIAWHEGREEAVCGGLAIRPRDASLVARCEAVERFHVAFARAGEMLAYGSYREVKGDSAIDPESIFFRSPRLPQGRRYLPYDDSVRMYWTWADDPQHESRVLVPAQEVWFDTNLLPGEHLFVRNTTNGCAVGATAEEAALFALCELVERDAYLVLWYLRRRCEKIIPESVLWEPFQLLLRRLRYACPNYTLHFCDIRTEIAVPAVAVVATRDSGRGPRMLHAAAARPTAALALTAALKEICGRIAPIDEEGREQRAERFLREPEAVFSPEDHKTLFSTDEAFDRIAFLGLEREPSLEAAQLDRDSPIPRRDSYNLKDVLSALSAHLAQREIRVLFKEISHLDFIKRDMRCVKAIAPGLYPMWYGHSYLRFAPTERLRKLAERFVPNGAGKEQQFNLDVHPFG